MSGGEYGEENVAVVGVKTFRPPGVDSSFQPPAMLSGAGGFLCRGDGSACCVLSSEGPCPFVLACVKLWLWEWTEPFGLRGFRIEIGDELGLEWDCEWLCECDGGDVG